MSNISKESLQALYSECPQTRYLIQQYARYAIYQFQPRPDDIEAYDQQKGFVESEADFSILLGGTGSGKTIAAAYKTAMKVLFEPPEEPELPFWIIGQTYDLVGGVCWKQKLRELIPKTFIKSITWVSRSRGWPASVLLKHPTKSNEPGWELVFRSYQQGRERLQAYSIGGYWFNEECPLDLVYEVQGRCREYNSKGWADFTPLSMASYEWKNLYDDPPAGWRFFHLNTLKNKYLAKGWASRYLTNIPSDMRPMRQYGFFGQMQGRVYKEWNRGIHVLNPQDNDDRRRFYWLRADQEDFGIPEAWDHFRGLDFGYNNPFACVWIARDPQGRYFVYDEYYRRQCLLEEHVRAIKKRQWKDGYPGWHVAYADPSAAQERLELSQLGVSTRPAKNRLLEGIEVLRTKMKPSEQGDCQFYVLSHCKNVIREMEQYHWELPTGTGLREKNAADRPVAKHDHALDAIRYVIYSEERETANFSTGIEHRRRQAWKHEQKHFFD